MELLFECMLKAVDSITAPHIHASFSGCEVVVELDGEVIEGEMPKGKMKLLLAWMEIHREELERILDAKPILSLPMYQPLKNKGFIDLAKADGMCIYWNEDVDLCPDMVYTDSRPI